MKRKYSGNDRQTFGEKPAAEGMKGFFVTSVRRRERSSFIESCNLINSQIMDVEEKVETKDIEKQVEEEIKQQRKKALVPLETDMDCVVLMELASEHCPVELAKTIFSKVTDPSSKKTRFTLRLVPFQNMCLAKKENIVAAVEKLSEQYHSDPQEFAIHIKIRQCGKLERAEVIESVASVFINKGHTVDLSAPKLSVVIEVVRNMAAVCIIPNGLYMHMRRMNLPEIYQHGPLKELVSTKPSKEAEKE